MEFARRAVEREEAPALLILLPLNVKKIRAKEFSLRAVEIEEAPASPIWL